MVRIDLDLDDMELVEMVAAEREARYAKVPSNYGTVRDRTKDLAGVAGEVAVAHYTGLPWTGRDSDYGHDVGNLEVRTRRDDRGRLCVHDLELQRKQYAPGQRFVLARHVSYNQIELVGWSWLNIILRRGEYIAGRTYLPNHLLHDIETVLL
jgi:hypothetical protein